MSLIEAAVHGPRITDERRVVALGVLGMLTIIGVDLLLGGDIGVFFDLCFIVLCLVLAVRADRGTFYTLAILPPLLLLGGFMIVAAIAPSALGNPGDGSLQALITGVLTHAVGLAVGYGLCLATLGVRMLSDDL